MGVSNRAGRRAIVLLFCLVMGFHVLRSAVVAAPGPFWLGIAERVWPEHPRVLTFLVMRDVGLAAAQSKELSPSTVENIRSLAERQPLAPEPYLVLGAQAYQSRELERAEKLLLEARRRNPRSPAARYLLGSLYIESGRLEAGLKESAALARLLPGAAAQLAPALAQYISAPGAAEQVFRLLKTHADLAPPLLNELAANPRNADLLVSLSSTVPAGAFSQRWQKRLIGGLLDQQDYSKAWSIWARLNGLDQKSRAPIYDAGFQDSDSAPPFNWELARQGAVVERRDGRLHVVYFGRDDVTLARQVLLLVPGSYRIEMDISGNINGSQDVRWELSCLPGRRMLLEAGPGGGSGSRLRASFEVPSANCRAQDLRLKAEPGEFPDTSDFTIANFSLTRTGRS